tara:strand:+ start:1563 stop:1973 length:411 start_codon:yes stop_codon:yes gene_type:complete
MANFNQVIMMGNLTKDPEIRELPSGDKVCNLRIAVNSGYKEKKETLFIDVSCWNAQAINCGKYLVQGKNVAVVGRLKQEEWADNEGNKQRRMTIQASNVQFLDRKGEGSDNSDSSSSDISAKQETKAVEETVDIPF